MSLTFEEAVEEMSVMLKAAWDPTTYQLHYDDIRIQRDDSQVPWAVATFRHAGGSQQTMGAPGGRTFNRNGILFVTINTPSGSGLPTGYQLAKVVADAYEGKSSPSGAWFRNVRINELGRDGTFFKMQVLIEFQYYELK